MVSLVVIWILTDGMYVKSGWGYQIESSDVTSLFRRSYVFFCVRPAGRTR